MEREFKEIITPISKQKIVLKAWITAKEDWAIRGAYYKMLKVKSLVGKEASFGDNINATLVLEREKKAVENIVVSIDGNKENVMEAIGNMRKKDYLLIKAEVMKIVGEVDF